MPIYNYNSFRFILLFFLQIGMLFAQNLSQIDVLTMADGLNFRDVRAIAQDDSGLMWFGTSQGLNRYDGYNFKVYNSDKKNPFFIEEELFTSTMVFDKDEDALWFMANEDLFKLHLPTDSITAYNEPDGIKGKVLGVLKVDDGAIWIITEDYWSTKADKPKQYLQKYKDGKFEVMASISRINKGFSRLSQDSEGFLWWSTPNGNLKYHIDGSLLAFYDLGNYEWHGSEMHFVASFFDCNNRHYYFPHDGGIYVLNEENQSSERILDVDNEFGHAIQDEEGYTWFAGQQRLYRMSPQEEFVDYTDKLLDHFDYTKINSLFIDASNLLWVATDNGLFKIRTGVQMFKNVFKSNKSGWGNSMRGVFEDHQGTIYAHCENKNSLFSQDVTGKIDTLKLYAESNEKIELHYACSFFVFNKAKTHVFTVGKTMYKINLETGETVSYDQFIPNLKVYGPNPLIRLRDGRLLFGYTLSRLLLFDPETEKSEAVFSDDFEFDEVSDLAYFFQSKTEDMIWVGTQNSGLLKINLNGSIEETYSIYTNPSVSKNNILVIDEDLDGSLWIGTYGGGLNHISKDGTTIKKYSKAQGLADDNVTGILSDKKDNLWISTYNGISYFDKQTELFQNFYTEDGLSHNECNYSSCLIDSQGNYYFGGMNGLNVFKPDEVFKTSEPPQLRFLGISGYNSKNKSSFNTDYSHNKFTELTISPYDQYFQLDWTMPSFFNNQKSTYSTTLEGYEDRWFYQGHKASIRYNKLPAGDYVLKVKGTDAIGNESAAMLSIPIKVKQIFYKTWWFILLALCAAILFGYSVFRYRLNQVIAMERLRTKISSDLHDDVGSMLSGLAMQTELLEINANEADKFKLQKIATISRSAVSQMRDLVWSIDSRRGTVDDLIERMRELAEELLLPMDIAFNIEAYTIINPNKKLPAEIKQNVFMIYKEALTNCLKHANATQVNVSFSNINKGCELSIKDNGTNTPCLKYTGLGLSNMALRAKKINGQLRFEKENGFGIILRLPFNL